MVNGPGGIESETPVVRARWSTPVLRLRCVGTSRKAWDPLLALAGTSHHSERWLGPRLGGWAMADGQAVRRNATEQPTARAIAS